MKKMIKRKQIKMLMKKNKNFLVYFGIKFVKVIFSQSIHLPKFSTMFGDSLPLIINNGSYHIVSGFSGDCAPRAVFPSESQKKN